MGVVDAGANGNDSGVSRRICDGSSEIRFAFSYGDDRSPETTSVLYDLGGDYLYVDGTCHYWVDNPSIIPDEYRDWRAPREGILTTEQEVALQAAVGYNDFSQAPACPSLIGVADASVARMWDGERVHLCPGGLDAAPDWPMRTELYSAAYPVQGPMRIKVSTVPVDDKDLKYEWPLGDPVATYLVDYRDRKSFRIGDAAEVEALRLLRERVIADATQTPGYFPGFIEILPGDDIPTPGQGYALAVRDDLPFTDSDGQWSPP